MAIDLHTKLCDMLDIEYPVMAFSHCRDIVAAVSNAGGCGVLGALALTPDQITQQAGWINDKTNNKPFGIDLVFPKANPQKITQEQLMAMIPQAAILIQGLVDFSGEDSVTLSLPTNADWLVCHMGARLDTTHRSIHVFGPRSIKNLGFPAPGGRRNRPSRAHLGPAPLEMPEMRGQFGSELLFQGWS